jgi:hypothetical protein
VEPIRRQVAGGGAIPEGRDGLLDAESTLEFHRLYSAIFFLTNMTEDDGEPQDQSVFGDGLTWGGCLLMHVLGQQNRFNGARTATSAGMFCCSCRLSFVSRLHFCVCDCRAISPTKSLSTACCLWSTVLDYSYQLVKINDQFGAQRCGAAHKPSCACNQQLYKHFEACTKPLLR